MHLAMFDDGWIVWGRRRSLKARPNGALRRNPSSDLWLVLAKQLVAHARDYVGLARSTYKRNYTTCLLRVASIVGGIFVSSEQCLDRDLEMRNRCTLLLDSPNENTSVASWNLFKNKTRCTVFFDVLHRIWRALWYGSQCAGSLSYVFLWCHVASTKRGPFNSNGNLQAIREWTLESIAAIGDDTRGILWSLRSPAAVNDWRAILHEPAHFVSPRSGPT